jgi:hypothetical protein
MMPATYIIRENLSGFDATTNYILKVSGRVYSCFLGIITAYNMDGTKRKAKL